MKVLSLSSKTFGGIEIAENRSECKESTKENQGEVFSGIMDHRPKTIDHFKGLSEDHQRLWKTMADYRRQSTIIKDNG